MHNNWLIGKQVDILRGHRCLNDCLHILNEDHLDYYLDGFLGGIFEADMIHEYEPVVCSFFGINWWDL